MVFSPFFPVSHNVFSYCLETLSRCEASGEDPNERLPAALPPAVVRLGSPVSFSTLPERVLIISPFGLPCQEAILAPPAQRFPPQANMERIDTYELIAETGAFRKEHERRGAIRLGKRPEARSRSC